MDKNKRIITTLIVIFFYVILIILNLTSNKFNNKVVSHICYIFPLLWALVTYIYNHWGFLFIPVNRVWAIINGVTSSFQLSYRFSMKKVDFDNNFSSIYDNLCEKYKVIDKKESKGYKVIELKKDGLPLRLNFRINSSDYDSDNNVIDQIVVILNASLAYKDSKKVADNFFNIISMIDKETGTIVDESRLDNVSENSINYGCIIELSKYNPFYRYQVKHISTEKKTKFKKMILQDEKTKISITTNKMIIDTSDQDKLKSIVKEYIPISNIG